MEDKKTGRIVSNLVDANTKLMDKANYYKSRCEFYEEGFKELQQRIDKAIEEIKTRSSKDVANLYINILQGSDKNENI